MEEIINKDIINIDNLCDDFTKKTIITKKESINENQHPDKVKETIEVKENIKKIIKLKKVVDKVVDKVIVKKVIVKKVIVIKDIVVVPERKEVQAHGFTWENELLMNVYKATHNELKEIKYNSKMDLPATLNRLDVCDISVKTSCSPNAVYMSDCLRMFDAVSSDKPLHMVVVHYTQDDINNTKKINSIIEIDLTTSHKLLFGELTRAQLEELDKAVKSVPQKRKPTAEEYNYMYSIRNKLQVLSNAIHLDIKCNSTQSRLQCSFNSFQKFIEHNPSKVIAKSNSNEFRGGHISLEITSSRRVFKSKI